MKIYFTNQLSYIVSELQRTNFAGSNVMAITEFDLIDKSQGSVTSIVNWSIKIEMDCLQ